MRNGRLVVARHMLLLIGGALLLETLLLPPGRLWGKADLVIANLLPVLGLLVSLYLLLGRILCSLVFSAAIVAAVRFLHDEKLAIMGLPLSAADTVMFGQVLESPGLALNYIGWLPVFGFVAFLVVSILLLRRETPRLPLWHRAFALLGATLLLFFLREPIKQHYLDLRQTPWEVDPSMAHMGVAAYVVQDALLMDKLETPVADAEVIARVRSGYALPPASISAGRPDLIVWLGESFIDPRIFRDIDSCELIPAYCGLADRNIHGTISVPTFAGATIRTEFEVLTGIPMAVVPDHKFPYISLTNVPVNSIAWELRDLGYETTAIHNHARDFWHRPVAFRNLGFGRWIGLEDLDNVRYVGYYAADGVLTDSVMELLDDSNASASPKMVFVISMQAHGPYGRQPRLPREEVEAIPVPEQLDHRNGRILREYFYHLRSADRELSRLAAFVDSRQRPTLVLYFGDHMPGMREVYQQIEFENGLGPREQPIPWLIFANYPLPGAAAPSSDLAAWQLPTLTLRVADLLGKGAFAWFNLLNDKRRWLPRLGTRSEDAAIYDAENDKLYAKWLPRIETRCEDAACEALVQFAYAQLSGPRQQVDDTATPPKL